MTFKRFLYQGRYESRADQKAHLDALGGSELSSKQQYQHDHLYSCLTILDQKATALLSFDSILVATSTIVLTILKTVVTVGSAVIFSALLLAGASAVLNLFVISLKWTETAELRDPDAQFVRLLETRNRRSVYYRCAWICALLALVLLAVGIVIWKRV